jgi:hypothetical protein
MKITRERKLYAAIFGLALLGLTLDRTIYGSSEAPVAPTNNDAIVTPAPAPATGSINAAEEASLAGRLISAANEPEFTPAHIREPFKSQLPWLASVPATTAATPSSSEQFAARHALTALMGSGQNGYAIIDGVCVRIGRTIDGFRLVSVDGRSATLESGADQVRLILKTNLAGNF